MRKYTFWLILSSVKMITVSLKIPAVLRSFVMLPITSSTAVTIPDDGIHGRNRVTIFELKKSVLRVNNILLNNCKTMKITS